MMQQPRVGAGFGNERDDDADEYHADEPAAMPDRRVGPEHAPHGIAGSQCQTQESRNVPVYAEEQQRSRIRRHVDDAGAG
jgi:hypothetical protein